jgi:general secretion pathway protein D
MLLCANNAPAEFFSGVTRMITTNYDFETRYDDNNNAVDIARPTVEERNIGTTVRIKPSINADGTVTLRFLLELSAVSESGANIFQVNSAGQVIALPIDTVDNERAESIVVARHGQAVVMGGLIAETVSKNRSRVPVAGDLPLLGVFLGKRVDEVSRSETIMVIVPHIIAASGAEGQTVSNTVLGNNATTHPMAGTEQKGLTHWDPKSLKIQEVDPAASRDPIGKALQNAPALGPGETTPRAPEAQPSNQ